MQSQVEPRARRVHGAQIKSKVLAECRQPGASVSAVALAHGLNANLVRKWLRGRGLQRAGLKADDGQPTHVAHAARSMPHAETTQLQFVPVQVRAPCTSTDAVAAPMRSDVPAGAAGATIAVELRRGGSQVAVRWPATQAAECAAWLRELAAGMLK